MSRTRGIVRLDDPLQLIVEGGEQLPFVAAYSGLLLPELFPAAG